MKPLHPLLDLEKQKLARQYEKEKRRLGLAGLLLSLFFLLGYYITGLSTWASTRFPEGSFLWAFLAYGCLFLAAITVFGLPLDFYNGYLHEHRWNFSNQTVRSWCWEQCKSFIVGLALLYLFLGLLLWFMAHFPDLWWLIAAAAFALVGVVFATLFPVVILPLFNTYTPIEDPELTSALERILERGGLKAGGFFREDMSRQTKKENAFLAGLGRTRRVVLADNLMAHMEKREIESIIAHEVGHFRHHHIWKNILAGTLQQVLTFFLIHLALRLIFPNFPASARENLALLPLIAILFGFISGMVFGPSGQALSRRFERQADAYALASIPDSRAFQTALAGLADRNLSNAYPVWWIKMLYYSHPPIGERLDMADPNNSS